MILQNFTKAYKFLWSMALKEPPEKLQIKRFIKISSDRC